MTANPLKYIAVVKLYELATTRGWEGGWRPYTVKSIDGENCLLVSMDVRKVQKKCCLKLVEELWRKQN